MRSVIRAPKSDAVSERETKNRELARRICAQGIVLLKNKNSALPLTGGRVSLFGRGVRHTEAGGTGSGEVRPRERVNIEQGFLNAGWEVCTKRWLDEEDSLYAEKYRQWEEEMERIFSRLRLDFVRQIERANAHRFQVPYGGAITNADVQTDTVVYVLSRQAGEGTDRKNEPGDFLIAPEELEHLRQLKKLFAKVVLVINAGGMIDLTFDEEIETDAIVYLTQGGMEGGNALADVLTGACNFSGKLADTWGRNYSQYPFAHEYGSLSGDALHDIYKEGVLLGYKWFESAGLMPRYPFGFGLSYTKFCISDAQVSLLGGRAVVSAKVRNIGEKAGREVAQVYAALPKGSIPKEVQRLVAFTKTEELLPGGECEVRMLFELSVLASYFEQESRYKIEKGDYILRVGNSSEDLQTAAAVRFKETVTTEICKKISEARVEIPEFLTPAALQADSEPVVVEYTGGIVMRRNEYTYQPKFDQRTEEIYKKFNARDKARLVTGAGYFGKTYNQTFGAVGKTTSRLLKKGIPNICMCDGPQGLNLTPRAVEGKNQWFTVPAVPQNLRYGVLKKLLNLFTPKEKAESSVYYQYCTQWPCETLLAQTWDCGLLYEMGRATGSELLETGVTLWLAPGMNLHRNPLCGRNFEYYSEDPLLTGKLAASLSQGVNSCGGIGVTYKHFACNDREEERQRMSVEISERALRETHLKGFEIAAKEGNPKAVMTSYNRINGAYVSNTRELCVDVLRCEWGFSGLVMTDWFATGRDTAAAEECVPAGNDLVMPGSVQTRKKVLRAYKKGKIREKDMAVSCKLILKTIMESAVYTDGRKPE